MKEHQKRYLTIFLFSVTVILLLLVMFPKLSIFKENMCDSKVLPPFPVNTLHYMGPGESMNPAVPSTNMQLLETPAYPALRTYPT